MATNKKPLSRKEQFVVSWQKHNSAAEVASEMNIKITTVNSLAWKLRHDGVALKYMSEQRREKVPLSSLKTLARMHLPPDQVHLFPEEEEAEEASSTSNGDGDDEGYEEEEPKPQQVAPKHRTSIGTSTRVESDKVGRTTIGREVITRPTKRTGPKRK